MRTPSARSLRLVAIAPALIVSMAFAGASNQPELGTWGVDLTTRDTSVKPGDDFYRYANGKWLDTFEIPGGFAGIRILHQSDAAR